ncbi:MAG TPA: GGDEF domain-containing protein [Terracidiphilus sp.]|nr:GGDEF domain-containing protein [Terracidiphilus sp.]
MTNFEGTGVPAKGIFGTHPWRRWTPVLVLLAAWVSTAWAAPGPLTSLRAIQALSNAQASQGIPVEFSATVTYFRNYEKILYVQNGDVGLLVRPEVEVALSPGDQVLIHGKTQAGFAPTVDASSVVVMGHGGLPAAIPATYDQLIRSQFDGRMVTVYATVRDAATVMHSGVRGTLLQMHTDSGEIKAQVDVDNPTLLSDLLDAQVLVTGVASAQFDDKMRQTGVVMYVTSMSGVKVLRKAATDPWSLPITPMKGILADYRAVNASRRVRVRGTLTYYEPGSTAVLQSGKQSLRILIASIAPLRIGDLADATGFPEVHDGFLTLTEAEIQDLGTPAPVTPEPTTWDKLSTSSHLFDLVSVEGNVMAQVRSAAQDEYVLEAKGNLFSATFQHPQFGDSSAGLPAMKHVALGSKVRVTGICFMNNANPFSTRTTFNILLRSPEDIDVIDSAPWLTVGNLTRLVGLLFLIVVFASAWVWLLRRRVRQQTAAITAQSEAETAQERRIVELEQWRSRILEEINTSQSLSDVVEHITEMVSYSLNGVPCWCEVVDGPVLGKPPSSKSDKRILSREILSRSGIVLGNLLVAFSSKAGNEKEESDAMLTGVRLATLAIETRKLYADLVYRSDFDQLTDMYNRFTLDRLLEEQIAKAQENSSVFGLIYVDLDEFKQVNDLYGHHVGDLYLQEVSLRMKRQLRSGDMLARLGGDEFAALVSVVRNRADVEDIAQRLERCFDAPFTVEGYILRGSASIGISLYPNDGATADSLLSSADASMYVAKHTRRQHSGMQSRRGA